MGRGTNPSPQLAAQPVAQATNPLPLPAARGATNHSGGTASPVVLAHTSGCAAWSGLNAMARYFSFQWHITDECDQRCKHCYIYSGGSPHSPVSMSQEAMDVVLSNCLDFCRTFSRTPYFYITGGDPLLHPAFWYLADELAAQGIHFTILGNPFHLTSEVCGRLKASGCDRVQLSLDGLRETHDWFRRSGSFDETLSALPLINGSGMRSVIMSTVSRANIEQIPSLIDVVVASGASVFSFARYVPQGGAVDLRISPQEYRAFLATCDEHFCKWQEEGVATYFDRKDHLWTLYDWEQGAFHIPQDALPGMIYGGCNCGSSHLTILPTGEVMACRRVAASTVGSALTDRLAALWTGAMEAFRDYAAFAKCSRCRLLPYCRGCPAVARGTHGEFYAADPQCWVSEGSPLLSPR